jgi:hypothetical protein
MNQSREAEKLALMLSMDKSNFSEPKKPSSKSMRYLL